MACHDVVNLKGLKINGNDPKRGHRTTFYTILGNIEPLSELKKNLKKSR